MAEIVLDGLAKAFGSIAAVDHVALRIPDGQFVCLLGPSGCGKTTLLRLIAGLDQPDAGCVLLDGRDITAVPAHQRNFGMVFQSHALFPHLTAGENIAYGLRVHKVGRAERKRRVQALLELVKLGDVADRHISQLSGGQRQRVAIARALALQPALFLLDEPLSALDAKLREELQVELRQLQQRLGITTLLVTHDQREAMTMADKVVIMDQGKVQQQGSPLDVYQRPANTFVANFIGSTNLLRGVLAGRGELSVGGASLAVSLGDLDQLRPGSDVSVSIRPEDLHLLAGDQPGPNRWRGRVTFVRHVGASVETYVDCEGQPLICTASRKDSLGAAVGDSVTVELPREALVVLAS